MWPKSGVTETRLKFHFTVFYKDDGCRDIAALKKSKISTNTDKHYFSSFQAAALRSANGDQQFIYSAHVSKLGRNMKASDRAILLSEKHLYRLEMPGYAVSKKKPPLQLHSIRGVSLLSGPSQAVVIHLKVSWPVTFSVFFLL